MGVPDYQTSYPRYQEAVARSHIGDTINVNQTKTVLTISEPGRILECRIRTLGFLAEVQPDFEIHIYIDGLAFLDYTLQELWELYDPGGYLLIQPIYIWERDDHWYALRPGISWNTSLVFEFYNPAGTPAAQPVEIDMVYHRLPG